MSRASQEKSDSIKRTLDYLQRERPLRAEEACRDYLTNHPGCVDHLRLLGLALLKQNRAAAAEESLRFALSLDPDFPQLHEDLGSALAMQSRFDDAVTEFKKAIQMQPALPLARRKLGQALIAAGRGDEADEALRDYVEDDPERAAIIKGAQLYLDGKIDDAIELYRDVLKKNPGNVNAMQYLAGAYWQEKKRPDDAEALLRRAVHIAPDFARAWMTLGALFMDTNKFIEAIAAFEKATKLEPRNPDAWSGLGNANGRAMYPEKAIEAFEKSLAINDMRSSVLGAYAWELKTVGNQAAAVDAYRKAVCNRPSFGPAYWSMANLKIFKFEEEEICSMLAQVERDDLTDVDDIHFRFALGKAMEDKGDYDQAWQFYHTGNQRQRATVDHDPVQFEGRMAAIKSVFESKLLGERAGVGYAAGRPIFIVGLPRSGSTLVEQILASHSQVEGTSELPLLGRIVESIGRYRTDGVSYPEGVTELRDKDLRGYGKQYIDESRRYRTTEKPLFTDKLPNNFPMLGFAHLILPNAIFINARRHPFDTCLGAYKQLFGQGQNFTYDMLDLAHYYQQYDAMMKHWQKTLPGKVLDVHYEETVSDLETQVRRILDHCGLPFEENCLRFYETERAVKTASSEQVRQPIYSGALGKWRHYEKHLDLWQQQLGHIVDELPEVSRNAGLPPKPPPKGPPKGSEPFFQKGL
ncbi:MAG: sulfotransferase [Woeseiaceae bacterium]|nr:sulfotransferase [Woeseiaceae bacterium]